MSMNKLFDEKHRMRKLAGLDGDYKSFLTEGKFQNFISKISRKGFDAIVDFINKVAKETKETKEAAKIIKKYIKGQGITPEEDIILKRQIYDILKAVGIGVPFMLIPGSSILLPLIIKIAKRKGINLLPSAFAGGMKTGLE